MSIQAKFIEFVFRIIGFKSIIQRMAIKPARSKQFVPQDFINKFYVKTQTIDSKLIATIKNRNSTPKLHLIYLHGGAYVFEMSGLHWTLIDKLLNKIDCRITVIDYPLAPEANYKDTFQMLSDSYQYLIQQYPSDKFIFMGDSAGGGLALAFTQKLLNENFATIPEKLVLVSPWIDLALENPDINIYEKQDIQLSKQFLNDCADKYSNGTDKKVYLLSPINGNFKNLPSTIVFYGTHELFFPDIREFRSKAEKENLQIKFNEYENMQHDWILFPIPEAEKTLKDICDFIIS